MNINEIEYLYPDNVDDGKHKLIADFYSIMKDVTFFEMVYGNSYIHIHKDDEGRVKAIHVGS